MTRLTSSFYFFCMVILSYFAQLPAESEKLKQLQEIPDPYLSFEDENCPALQEWLEKQKQTFDQYIQSSSSERDELKKKVKALADYESYSIPIQRGNKYFFKRRLPSEEQAVLYIQEGLHGIPRVLVDPNQLTKEYPIALADYVPSPDGQYVAYGLAENGSDWVTWRVLHSATGKNQDDRLERIKFVPVAWTPDSLGLYYSRLDNDEIFRLYYHRLGTSQEEDQLIPHNFQSREFSVEPFMSSDGQFLMINVMKGSTGPNAILYRDLNHSKASFETLIPMSESNVNYSYICSKDSYFYFWTNQGAPRGKVIAVDKNGKIIQEVIKEGKHPLKHVSALKEHLILVYSEDVTSRLFLSDFEGQQLREIALPEMGQVSFLNLFDSSSESPKEFFFSFTHFVQPSMIYRYSLESNQLSIFKSPSVPFHSQDYLTRQIFFSSKDGTKVPLFIVHRKDLSFKESHPTILYGYGGFNISVYPFYSALHMAWVESGGILAVANIRGGSEYGEEWHQGGKGKNKQNCFDDFITAAEWLIANKYTTPSKLAIRGRSNGGLLTAVCLNQRPELFGAGLVEVGVLDMLRFHRFTVGHFWISEYGNPENPEEAEVIKRYSPYHNVRKGIQYPSTLVITADHDDRVVPCHSYKYTAALQDAQAGEGKVLLRLDTKSGHGAGKSISQWTEEAADVLLFLKKELR